MRLSHVLLASSLILAPLAAHADNFTINYFGDTVTYSLPASPTIDPVNAFPDEIFQISNVSALLNGVSVIDTVGFFTNDAGGGLYDSVLGIAPFGGQYFTGDVSAPTFVPGTYEFFGGGSVTITGTPEPSSLVLLGTGALGLAGAIRRRFSK